MYVLGLTGLMASGKTTVSKMLKGLGAFVISSDDIVYELQKAGTPQTAEVAARLGDSVLNEDGSLNRRALAAMASEMPDVLNYLESVFHPAVRQTTKDRVEIARKNGNGFVVLEVPLMFETGADVLCDSVMLCLCSDETRKNRAFDREGMTEEKWQLVNSRRLSVDELISKSNHLIDTETAPEETRENVVAVINFIK